MILQFWLAFIAELILMVSIIWASRQLQKFPKIILRVMLFYIFLGVTVRSAVLILWNPRPSFGDAIADPRLILNGSYYPSLQILNSIEIISLISYLLATWIFAKYFNKPKKYLRLNNYIPFDKTKLYLVLTTGFLSSYLTSTGSQNPVLKGLSLLTVPTIAMIFFDSNVWSKGFRIDLEIGFLLCITSTLFMFTKSKSYFGAVALLLFIILKEKQERQEKQEKKKVSKKFFSFLVSGTLVAISVDVFVQAQLAKNIQYRTANSLVGAHYFGSLGFIYLILQRFDLLSALTDAYYGTQQSFLHASNYVTLFIHSFHWSYGTGALTFGQKWAENVSAISNPGNLYTGVSLSTGPASEGWLVGNYLGVFCCSLLFVILVLLVTNMTLSSPIYLSFVSSLILSNVFFEGGFIMLAESISQASKVVFVLFMVKVLRTNNFKSHS